MPRSPPPKGILSVVSGLKTRFLKIFSGKDHPVNGNSDSWQRSAFEPKKRNKPSFITRYLDMDTPDGFSLMLILACLMIAGPSIYAGLQNDKRAENRARFINTIIKDKTRDYSWLDKEIDPNEDLEDNQTEKDDINYR